MPASSSEQKMLKRARLVFKGTVRKLKAANVAEVDKKDRGNTIIVRVDEVVQAPETLGDYTGQEITVKLSEGEKVKIGQKAIFYATTWIFSDNIAVESVGHRNIEDSALAHAAAAHDPAKNLASQEVKGRLDTADVVVTGKVTSIRLPEAEKKPAAMAAKAKATEIEPSPSRPISEHDPHWREAVVEVAGVEKGTHDKKKKIIIRFPDSNDVRWYKAPKFRPGQEGVFILHKTQKRRPAKARAIAATLTNEEADATEAYTALHPADFQPLRQSSEIKTLIKGISSPVETPDSDNE